MQRMNTYTACALLAVLLIAGPAACWGRPLRSSSSSSAATGEQPGHRRLQQATPVTFVPTGCQGLTVAVSGSYGYDEGGSPQIFGSVTLSNPNTFDIPIASVTVQAANNIPVAPISVPATCTSSVVPANPQPYALGTTTCSYAVPLPTNGIAAGFNAWPSVMATATIGMSSAQCQSGVSFIPHAGPILYAPNPTQQEATAGSSSSSSP